MRPVIDAQVIGELRSRVIRHNEANPTVKAKLGELRKVYERGCRRSNSPTRGLDRVDGYLDALAKSAFDEGKHKRADDGEFEAEGALPASAADHHAAQGRSAGYRAITTDVIPEQRYEAGGSLLRDGTSLAAGAGIVGSLASKSHGKAVSRIASTVTGSVGRIVAGSAGALAGQAAHRGAQALRRTTGFGPDITANNAKGVRRWAAGIGETAGRKAGKVGVTAASAVVRGAMGTAGDASTMHPAAVKRFRARVAQSVAAGRPLHAAAAAERPAAMLHDRRLRFTRKAGAFGVLAGTVGLGIRAGWKDSIVDPAAAGHLMDAFAFRSVQKAIGASEELGGIRADMTEALAKNGPAGGSMQDLSRWLDAGGGEDTALRKAGGAWGKGIDTWGPGITRLFTAGASLAGSAVGGGAGFGVSRATQPHGSGDGFQEADHPRDHDGKFTSKGGRDRRFAQVGSLLGGVAAGIAVFTALRRHNARMLPLRMAQLERRTKAMLHGTDWRTIGAAAEAKATTDARVSKLIQESPAFKKERAAFDEVKALGPSDPGVMRHRLRGVFHDGIAEIVSAHHNVEILQGKTWRTIGEVMRDESNPRKWDAKAKLETAKALANMTDADVHRMVHGRMEGKTRVGGLPEGVREVVQGHLADMKVKLNGVKTAMFEHSQKVTAATKEVDARSTDVRKANAELALASAKLKGTPEDETMKAAFGVAQANADGATAAHKEAQAVATKLINNPTGVVNPFTGAPVPAPTENEINGRLERMGQENTTRARKIIGAENDTIVAKQRARIVERHNNVSAAIAMRAATDGSPRLAQGPTKAMATLGRAEAAARTKLASARVAHSLNQPDFDALALATKYGPGGVLKDPPLSVMSDERRELLRQTGPAIRTRHETTANALRTAAEAHGIALERRNAATAVFQQAVEASAAPKKGAHVVSGRLRLNLMQAQASMTQPAREFFGDPTGQKLRAWAKSIKPAVANAGDRAWTGVKSGVKRTYDDLLTRDDGTGRGREFSPGKAMANAALVSSIVTAAKVDLATQRDRFFGDDEAKAAARGRRTELRREVKRDPVTGAGYFGLSVPDPNIPGERTLIWGEQYANDTSPARPLHAGGTMTDLRARMAIVEQQRNDRDRMRTAAGVVANAGVGPMANMPDAMRKSVEAAVTKLASSNGLTQYPTVQGGPVATMRSDTHQNGNDPNFDAASKTVLETLRVNHGLQQGPVKSAQEWHAALADLFSNEGKSMRARQAYRAMTGFDPDDGSTAKFPIFANNAGFRGDANQAGQAMLNEVTKVLGGGPPTVDQGANMMRAVAVAAHVKKIPAAALAEIFKRITAAMPQAPAAAPNASPFAGSPFGLGRQTTPAQPALTSPAPVPGTGLTVVPGPLESIDLGTNTSQKPPRPFDMQQGMRMAEAHAAKHAPKFGIGTEDETLHLQTAMLGLAREMHANSDTMTEQNAFVAVAAAFTAMHTLHPHADPGSFMFSAGDKDERSKEEATFGGLLLREARQRDPNFMKMDAGTLAEQIDALEKMSMEGFVESLHPRAPAGDALGGEFIEGNGGNGSKPGHGASPGGKITAEGMEAGGKYAGKAEAQAGAVQSWAHPVRLGTEFGGALGTEVALRGAQTVAGYLPGAVGKIAALGLEGAGAMFGGEYGAEAGGKVGSAAYTASTGKKAPGYNPPEYHDVGEGLAAAGGGMGGGLWGNAAGMTAGAWLGEAVGGTAGALVGGPVGAVALGAAAGWAGEKAAQGIYGYFAGFDKPAVDKAMSRFQPKGVVPVRGKRV